MTEVINPVQSAKQGMRSGHLTDDLSILEERVQRLMRLHPECAGVELSPYVKSALNKLRGQQAGAA